jgi:hypothetical protein
MGYWEVLLLEARWIELCQDFLFLLFLKGYHPVQFNVHLIAFWSSSGGVAEWIAEEDSLGEPPKVGGRCDLG